VRNSDRLNPTHLQRIIDSAALHFVRARRVRQVSAVILAVVGLILLTVDFTGAKLRLNKYAGSALKFWSPSLIASVFTYLFLAVLAGAAWLEWQASGG